ncbi:MAG: TRAP transporter small permease [Spirochaetota bacterium]
MKSEGDRAEGFLEQAQQWVRRTSGWMNWAAGGFVLAMMLLTTSDVVLRLFRAPITGTYDMVGLLGAAFVSFALAHTSLQKAHIAVDFLVRKLPPRSRLLVDAGTELLSLGLFVLVCMQSVRYAGRLHMMGEVSLTLRAPLHPFVYGTAAGSGMLCLVLLLRAASSLRDLRDGRRPPRH